jgi:DNA repair proteins
MQEKNYAIKHWAADDRPREKLLMKGAAALSDSELLAILITKGYYEKTLWTSPKKYCSSVKTT